MRLALDTNVLIHAEGLGDASRCNGAMSLIERLTEGDADVVIPVQVLGETFRVLTGKAGRTPAQARESILAWADAFELADSSWTAFQAAFDLVADHHLSLWDALILSVAAEQRCRLLLSEDLQDGFTWRGITVTNPFATQRSPLLQMALDGNGPS